MIRTMPAMIAHYTRMAVKALARYKLHTVISLLSLVFGFFCFISATLLGNYVDSFDQGFPNAQNIYNIVQVGTSDDAPFDRFPIVNEPASVYIRSAFPELEHVARTSNSMNIDVTIDGRTDTYPVRFVEAEFLDIFPLPLLGGTGDSSSLPPNSMLITTDAAIRRFGSTDVIGQVVTINNQATVSIVGVVDRFESPTHLSSGVPMFQTDMFVPIEVYDDIYGNGADARGMDPNQDNWGNQSYYVFLQFPPGTEVNEAQFNQRLDEFVQTFVPPPWGDVMTYELQPVNRLVTSLLSVFTQGFNLISVLQVAGMMVLLIGCLNYANLVIAQLSLRSQEIAVQKILGARRSMLIAQYSYESLLFVLLALAITLVGFVVLLTILENNGLVGAGPELLLSPGLWGSLFPVIAVIVLIAGFYPAIRTALVRLVTMMRPKGSGGYSGRLRALMVGTQFFVSGTLMILAIVMYNQNVTMTNQLDGDVTDPKVVITVPLDSIDVDPDLLIEELRRFSGVQGVTRIDRQPWELGMSTVSLSLEPDVNAPTVEVVNHNVGFEFTDTLGVPQLSGRDFSRERSNDLMPPASELQSRGGPFGLMIDETAAIGLGFADPQDAIGQTVYRHFDPPAVPSEIVVGQEVIGIVGKQKFQFIDYNTFGLEGDVYTLRPDNANYVIVRASRNNLNEALQHIDSTWARLLPDTPLKRVFADELFYETYGLFLGMAAAIGGLSLFGFFIASIGLLGNATFITNIRQKEVGIRKVMGASSTRLLAMLLFDFAKPVVIANAIAWPLGYVIASGYIRLFAERTDITLMPFLISLGLSVFIAVVAVVSQSWKSARTRPALTLRYE